MEYCSKSNGYKNFIWDENNAQNLCKVQKYE